MEFFIATVILFILYTIGCAYFVYLICKNWNTYTTLFRFVDIFTCLLMFVGDIVFFVIPIIAMIGGCA